MEIGGQQYLLNRAESSVKKVEAAEAQAFRTPPPVPPRAAEPEEVLERRPTFDYYLVNLPTNRVRPPRSLHLRFNHRFDDPAFKGTGRLGNLFGFDSFSRSSFGIEMGLLRWVSFLTYRTPYPRGAGRSDHRDGPGLPPGAAGRPGSSVALLPRHRGG